MQRREFLKTSAAASMAFATGPIIHINGQQKIYKTALIGCGWWGNNILRCAMQARQSKVVALCDVDQTFLNSTAETVRKMTGDNPKLYRDYRELLSKEKPEIVI